MRKLKEKALSDAVRLTQLWVGEREVQPESSCFSGQKTPTNDIPTATSHIFQLKGPPLVYQATLMKKDPL